MGWNGTATCFRKIFVIKSNILGSLPHTKTTFIQWYENDITSIEIHNSWKVKVLVLTTKSREKWFAIEMDTSFSKNLWIAINVTLRLSMQGIWRDIWKLTLAKNQISATNVTLLLFRQVIWQHTWRLTLEKKSYKCDFAFAQAPNLRAHLKTHSGEKSNKCN